jgi:hypothetical protein
MVKFTPVAFDYSIFLKPSMKFRTAFYWTAFLAPLLALAGLAYLGTFTRFHADDFCMAADATLLGLGGMLTKWYTIWTGRYMFILGTGLLGSAGPGLARWLPALAEVVWLVALAWAILPLLRKAAWPRPRLVAVITAGLALLVLFSATPNLFQSFFWQDGFVNYSLPLIGLTINGGLCLRVWSSKLNPVLVAIGAFLLAFVCGGFTEAFITMQIALFGLALLAAWVLIRKEKRGALIPVLAAAMAGGLVALLIVFVAPGNQVRQAAAVGSNPGLLRIITFSLRNAAFLIGKYFLQNPIWAFLSVAVPFLAGWAFFNPATGQRESSKAVPLWKEGWLKEVVLLLAGAFILVTAACAAVVYALDAYPDDRTIIVPLYIVILAAMFAGARLGAGLRQKVVPPVFVKKIGGMSTIFRITLLLILLACSAFSLLQAWRQAPEFQAYAQAWDKRAVILQQAGQANQSEVTVAGLDARFGVADLNADPNNWVNRCVADYYHISKVLAH